MGQQGCAGDHEFAVTRLGVGMARYECVRCGAVMVDLDAAEDGRTVTQPGLFGPSRPTIFTVLAEERRNEEVPEAATAGPRFAFGGAHRRP